MALRVWLPLNGNYKNQGLSSVNPAFTINDTVWTHGKIGDNLLLENKTTGYVTIPELNGTKNLTCCFWVKFSPNQTYTTWSDVCSLGIAKNGSEGTYRLENGDTVGRWKNWYGNGYVTDSQGTGGFNAELDRWYHLASIIDNDNGYIYNYVDGIQISSKSLSTYKDNFWFTGTFRLGDTGSYVTLADFRIYDECLSTKQIKEISKGLVCNYKFNTITQGNPNILTGVEETDVIITANSTITTQATGKWGFGSGGDGIGSITKITDCLNFSTGYCITNNTSGNRDFQQLDQPYENGKTYTASWYARGKCKVQFRVWNSTDNKQMLSSIKNLDSQKWVPMTVTFTATEEYVTDKCSYHIGLTGAGYVEVCGMKLEEGSKATPWLPNAQDKLYSQLYARDTSGYNFNGQAHGKLLPNTDSPRYKSSTDFNGPGYLDYLQSPLNSSSDAFTYTCWFYPTQTGTMALYNDRTDIGTGFSVFYLSGGIRFDTGNASQFQSGSITVNDWNFIACVYDKNNTIKKIYINGVETGSTSTLGNLDQIGTNASIGRSSTNAGAENSNQVHGSLSDVRIYCTALSADDILTMYKNGGIIDNGGNIYGEEIIETDKTIAFSEYPTQQMNYSDTFSYAVVNDAEAPTGKACKLTCTAVGTYNSRGYYFTTGEFAWYQAYLNMVHGKTYNVSMYVKMNKNSSNFKMNIECASSQVQDVFTVGTSYQKISSNFVYNANATYWALTNYASIFEVGDEVYIHSLKIEEVDTNLNTNISQQGLWSSCGSPNKNYLLKSSFIGKQDSGIITFNGDEAIFSTNTLGQTSGVSFGLSLDNAGKIDFRNKTLMFSMEYNITEALTFGTTNPWVGFEMSVSRNTTTGGSNQWLDWYGGKAIPTAITNGWVKYSKTVTVTDYDIAGLYVNFYMRDTTGTIKYRHPKIEIGNVATAWIPNEQDNNSLEHTHSFIEEGNQAKIQKNKYIQANSFIEN